jgi:hypothetical protein
MVNVKMDIGEVGWGGMDWIDLVPERDRRSVLVKAVMNLRVTHNAAQLTTDHTRRPYFHVVI